MVERERETHRHGSTILMNVIVPNLVITTMAVVYILLAVQAEPVTKTLGFTFGGFLFVAMIAQIMARGKE